jgi:hypothetical protein
MTKVDLALLVDGVVWRKTDYIQPHEYIVQENHPELFEALAEALENDKAVYSEDFKGWTYNYLVIGNYKYWRIDDIVNRQLVL